MLQETRERPPAPTAFAEPVRRRESPLISSLGRYLHFSAEERTALERLLELNIRTVKARTTFIEQGTSPAEISVIVSGWACRYKPTLQGTRQILAFHIPGDVCDFNALVTEAADTSTQALSDTKVAAISRDTLNQFSSQFPRISQALWRQSLVSAAVQREWMMNVCQRNAQARMAHLFCELAYRLRPSAPEGTDEAPYDIPVSQSDLGNACGLTSEHTSRTAGQLRRAGLAALDKGALVIPDLGKLKAFARFDQTYLQIAEQGALTGIGDHRVKLP